MDDKKEGRFNHTLCWTLQIFSSGDTSRTQDSSNCSIGRGGGGTSETGPHSTRLIYINERKSDPKQTDYKAKARRVQRGENSSHDHLCLYSTHYAVFFISRQFN